MMLLDGTKFTLDVDLNETGAALKQQIQQHTGIATTSQRLVYNDQVVAAVKTVEETFGRLDVVINNAGKNAEYKLIADSDVDDWWALWDINLRGTYHVTRAALPLLIKSGGDKTIINVGSLAAVLVAPSFSSYCVRRCAMLRTRAILTSMRL